MLLFAREFWRRWSLLPNGQLTGDAEPQVSCGGPGYLATGPAAPMLQRDPQRARASRPAVAGGAQGGQPRAKAPMPGVPAPPRQAARPAPAHDCGFLSYYGILVLPGANRLTGVDHDPSQCRQARALFDKHRPAQPRRAVPRWRQDILGCRARLAGRIQRGRLAPLTDAPHV